MRLSSASVMPTIPVADLARARRFYEEKLGLKPVVDGDDGIVFAAGDTLLLLYVRPPIHAEHTLASFQVDDLVGTIRDLKARGVTFEDYDLPGLKTVGHIAEMDDGRSAWFTDSEDNILAVTEPAGKWRSAIRPGRSGETAVNVAAARRIWERAAAGDAGVFDDAYAPDVAYHGSGGEEIRGSHGLKEYFQGFQTAFSDLSFAIEEVFGSDDLVTVRWTASGTHDGPLGDAAATGTRVSIPGITIERFHDGLVVEEWEQADLASLMAQIGATAA